MDPMSEDELGEEVVLKRRIEERIEKLEHGDRPWLRKLIGWSVIIASLAAGWSLLDERSRTIENQDASNEVAETLHGPGDETTLNAVQLCLSADDQAQIANGIKALPDETLKSVTQPALKLFKDPLSGQDATPKSPFRVRIQMEPLDPQTENETIQNTFIEFQPKSPRGQSRLIFGSITIQNGSVQIMRWTTKMGDKKLCSELLCSGSSALVCQCTKSHAQCK